MIVCERIEWIDGHEDEFAKCELIKPAGCDAIEPFGYADLDFAPCSMIALAGFRQLHAVKRRNIGTTDCSETKLIACTGTALIEPNAFELLARRNGGFVKCDKLKPVEYGAIESIRSDIEFAKSGGIAPAATLGFELISVALSCHQLGVAECRDAESIDRDETDLIECSGAGSIEPCAFELLERAGDRYIQRDKIKPFECAAIESARLELEFIKNGEAGSATTHEFELASVAIERSVAACRDVESVDCDKTDLVECSGGGLIEPRAFELLGRGGNRYINCDKAEPVECVAIASAGFEFEFIKNSETESAITHGFGLASIANGCHRLNVVECKIVESIDCCEPDLTDCGGSGLIEPVAFELFDRRKRRLANCDRVNPVEHGEIGSTRCETRFVKIGEIKPTTAHGFE